MTTRSRGDVTDGEQRSPRKICAGNLGIRVWGVPEVRREVSVLRIGPLASGSLLRPLCAGRGGEGREAGAAGRKVKSRGVGGRGGNPSSTEAGLPDECG